METEAKGQVGGVECDEETRRGIAKGTGEWKCGACGGRSNGEILEECKVLAEEVGRGKKLGGGEEEQRVEGIKIGYRDEIKKEEEGSSTAIAEASSTATAGGGEPSTAPQPTPPPNSHLHQHPRPALPIQQPQPPLPAPAPAQETETPWLDKLILALIAVLIAHVIKKIASHF